MKQQELSEIYKFIALNRGNCGDGKEFWNKFFELLDGLLEDAPISEKSNVVDNSLITITDDGKKKTSEIIAEMREYFKCYIYDEENVDKNFPKPKKPTSRKFAYTQEPDEKYKNMSADDLEKAGVECMNFRERLLFELIYWKKEGKHLDIEYITLCAGSRYPVGDVPGSDWDSGSDGFRSGWGNSDDADDGLRPRPVVS